MEVRRGRVRLDMIAIEQAEGRALDPALLAFQAAAVIRSLSPDWLVISAEKVSVSLSGEAPSAITIGALADYFDAIGRGSTPRTIASTSGEVLAAAVTVDRAWIAIPFAEAVKRAAFAAPLNGIHFAAAVANASPVARQAELPPPPSGSEPGYQKMRQVRQRQEGERSAAEQLEVERIARQRAQQEAIGLLAEREALAEQLRQALDEIEQLSRKLSDTRRAKQQAEDDILHMEEQLEAAMAFAECLRVDNEVSPPEMRLAFQCWREITLDGTHNPAGPGGRGIHGLAEAWLRENGYKLNKDATARFRAVLSWRKRGSGAIRSR